MIDIDRDGNELPGYLCGADGGVGGLYKLPRRVSASFIYSLGTFFFLELVEGYESLVWSNKQVRTESNYEHHIFKINVAKSV